MTKTLQNPPPQDEISDPLSAAFLLLMTKILLEKTNLGSSTHYPRDYGPQLANDLPPVFDIVIVGAGPAGVILANRLSEIESWSVLLLEAGDIPSAVSDVPAFHYALKGTKETWTYYTQKERNACLGSKGKTCRITRGKSLGGTSSINNLHYFRALPNDFNRWPSPWTANNIENNYKKHEHCLSSCAKSERYGKIGELMLDKINDNNEFKNLIYDAANIMDYKPIGPGIYLGYTNALGTLRDGQRENFAKAFLRPVKNRENLAVARNALVTKLVTQMPKDHRIQGVQVHIGGKDITVKARKEVILTTGAINTAQLLMLSGFGPKHHLKKFGIPVIVDAEIGKNLQDQITTLIFVGIDKDIPVVEYAKIMVDNTYSYMMHREGDLSQTNINDVVGLINTVNDGSPYPNLVIYHYFIRKDNDDLITYLNGFGLEDIIIKSIAQYNKKENIILFMPTLIKPKSRGEVQLRSNNPFDKPVIYGNFLSDPDMEDYQTLLSGVKYIMAMIETEPFRKRGARFLEINMPNCRNHKYCNEPYLGCVVKTMSVPSSQVIGTAAMDDVRRCNRVTSELLLLDGIRHLRIVDGSVIPEHVTGNLETTVSMMAEMAAHEIKKLWLKQA